MSLARPRSDPPGPPPIGRSVGPCSRCWGEQQSDKYPNPYEPGRPLPWIVCGYTPSQIASRVRDRPAARSRHLTAAPDDRDHRRVLLADDPPGRRTLLAALPTCRTARGHRLPRGRRAGHRAVPARPGRDAELVHRAGARRRVVARGGARARTSSTWRRQRRARPRPGAEPRGRQPARPTSISNSWGMPEACVSRGEIRALNAVFQQAAAQGIGVSSPRATTATTARSSGRARPASRTPARWSPRSAAPAWRSARAGQRLWETGWGTTASCDWNARRLGGAPFGDFLYGGGGGVSHIYASPPTRPAWCRRRLRRGRASCAASSPTCRWSPTRRPASSSRRAGAMPTGGRRIKSTRGSAAPASAAPLLAGMTALANQARHARTGSSTRRSTACAGTGVFRDIVPATARWRCCETAWTPTARSSPGCGRSTTTARSPRRRGWDDGDRARARRTRLLLLAALR